MCKSVLGLLLLVPFAFAQTTGAIEGVVTDPSVDGKVRSLAGMRLHTACTDDDRATESASETRETDTYADLCIVTPIARERARSNASGALSHRGRRERNSKPSIRQQECPVMRSCKGSNAALRGRSRGRW